MDGSGNGIDAIHADEVVNMGGSLAGRDNRIDSSHLRLAMTDHMTGLAVVAIARWQSKSEQNSVSIKLLLEVRATMVDKDMWAREWKSGGRSHSLALRTQHNGRAILPKRRRLASQIR